MDEKLILEIQQALSKEPKIKMAYVLGSAVSGRVKTDSDFDLAIAVDDANKINHNQIYQLISSLEFPKNLDLSIVDKKSSPLFLFQITSTGKCIYQKSDAERIAFEEYVMKNYYDTAHLRNIYASYLKERFPHLKERFSYAH